MKEIKCELVLEGAEIKLLFEDGLGEINFTNENQEEMKTLFSNLLGKLIIEDIEVSLSENLPEGVPQVHLDVSKEYIEQMTTELTTIRENYQNRYKE